MNEILLLLLIASLPALVYPLLYELGGELLRRIGIHGETAHHSAALVVSCSISLLLCFAFRTEVYGVISFNFGMAPLFVGILCGTVWDGAILAILQLLLYGWSFIETPSVTCLILDTGLLLYPLLFLSSSKFKVYARSGKYALLSLFLLVGGSISTFWPLLIRKNSIKWETYLLLTAFLITIFIMIIGLSVLYSIESLKEKDKLRQQIQTMSDRCVQRTERFQQLMDALPISIVLTDSQGTIYHMNRACQALFMSFSPAVEEGSFIGRNLEILLKSYHFETDFLQKNLQESLTSAGKLTPYEERVFYVNTCRIEGKPPLEEGVMVTIQDMTELESFRSELNNLDRLNLVGQMAAGITHEIRNPMAVVRGFLQLMREKSPSTLDHYYRIVMEELDRANGIISDFLSLAQNRPVYKETASLQKIIHELIPLVQADANLRGQSIEVDIEEQVPEFEMNAREIKQLILNLCRNAMEAMEDHGQLRLRTSLLSGAVQLEVADTGPGIPEAKLDKLFQPFYTTKAKGTGLGLVLCRSIVERHNGQISVRSEEGTGTTFLVVFPIS
ncbi:two-component system sensor histidine kinase NtrB [Paenibacillus sp. CAA11]|uniref:two-component system sensor histidine kinase NtrB n=1 Tax=Paenibacillus sp. CAA11 TaxID=1532905 RepID=UPI00131F0979|nr:ATP-binding protein [Paenibacillus sp. CAA11]